jgi:hypothetical protein
MRADPTISSATAVAVEAQKTKTFLWIPVPLQPSEQLHCATRSCARKSTPVGSPIVVNVVYRQKEWFSLSTALTFPTVRQQNFGPQSVVASLAFLFLSARIFAVMLLLPLAYFLAMLLPVLDAIEAL